MGHRRHASERSQGLEGETAGEADVVLMHFGEGFLEQGAPPSATCRSLGCNGRVLAVQRKAVVDDDLVGPALEVECGLEDAVSWIGLLGEEPMESRRALRESRGRAEEPAVTEQALSDSDCERSCLSPKTWGSLTTFHPFFYL